MKENPSAPKLLDFCNPIVKGDGKIKKSVELHDDAI